MANELVHGSVGTGMTQAEFEAIGLHVLNSQATGDVIYASSATQLSRLGIGSTNAILTVIGGVPTWQTSLSGLTFVAPALGAATATSVNGLVITTTAGTLTIANNASAALVTSGNYSITLTATAATNVTLPTTGTLATLAGTEELDNKTLDTSVAKGTWTSSAWGIPAGTLQGTLTLNAQTLDAGAVDAEFLTTGAGVGIQITNTNTGDTGARLTLYTNSANPAAQDDAGEVRFSGEDDASAKTTYGIFRCRIQDPAAATTRANMLWYVRNAGADNLAMQLTGPGILSVDDTDATTPAQVGLFDDYDDVAELQRIVQRFDKERAVELGLHIRKPDGNGYMMSFQPWMKLFAGAHYQTRETITEINQSLQEMNERLEAVEAQTKLLPQGGS